MSRLEHIIRRVDRYQQTHSILGFPYAVIKKFGNDRGGAFATRIAYKGLFSLFPLLLLLTTILGFALEDHPALRREVLDSALAQFPVLGTQLRSTAEPLEGSGIALLAGIAGAVYGGLGLGQAVEAGLNTVWDIPYVRWPNALFRRLRSALMVALLGAASLLSAALSIVSVGLSGGWIATTAAYAGSFAISVGVFLAAFMVLTAEPLRWRDTALGAVLAAVFWHLLQAVGAWLVTRQLRGASDTYGLFAVVIVLLSWMYLAAQLVLLAAEINVVRKYRLWPRSITQPPLTEADRKTFTRLARLEVRRPEYDVVVRFHSSADHQPVSESRQPP